MSSASREVPRAKPWKYLLGGIVALLVLVPLWMLFIMLIHPEPSMSETMMSKRLAWWAAAPVIAVIAVVGWRWHGASQGSNTAGSTSRSSTTLEQPSASTGTATSADREYVLEVVSLGITLDKYRQGQLWDALQKSGAYVSIREQDPKKYPWKADDKAALEGAREASTLENGAKPTPMYWGVPSFYAGTPILDPAQQPVPGKEPIAGTVGSAVSSGMAWHLFVTAPWELSERPDRLLEKVFAFFDAHPDVPYVVLSASDGLYIRDLYRLPGRPAVIKDGHYVPEMPDASALLVLARRERVDALRKFVWDEPFDTGLTRKLYEFYTELSQTVPVVDSLVGVGRQPTTDEWLEATRKFTQSDEAHSRGVSALAGDLGFPGGSRLPRDFKPTPWLPLPWNKSQISTFDKLPTLGYLHRPVFVSTAGDDGKPLTRSEQRIAALAAGWEQALQTLPESERKRAPARIVAATGGDTQQTVALHAVLNQWAEAGGPELDVSKSEQWIDADRKLGNTGAATWFVQMAVGVMGSYRQGGVSAAINLRDPKEASIVLISPPPEDKRKSQQHPSGGDVFKSTTVPAVDPSNYEQQ
ncbi:type VI lipase adapter Tla3 domain-containing protein [Eleftheria terrae]|uniref:type VI lipase adapter Tla3 domain-containing protein n=1 Tax=Eleftheria terrae TaxID=1597781 RepID=UPI00263BCA81|nr:DUF2875 family protein [Eleftheria terrae]WKB50895.1 DUF2875 family protein [Eleftheria terrae]